MALCYSLSLCILVCACVCVCVCVLLHSHGLSVTSSLVRLKWKSASGHMEECCSNTPQVYLVLEGSLHPRVDQSSFIHRGVLERGIGEEEERGGGEGVYEVIQNGPSHQVLLSPMQGGECLFRF